jgi:hypothetical protein
VSLANGDIRYWGQIAAIACLVLAAWRWGAGPERILAGVLVWFQAADAVNHAVAPPAAGFTVFAGHFVIDAIAAIVAVGVAIQANRIYTLWFAAFQLLALFAQIARDLAAGVAQLAYEVLYIGPSYFQILLLAGGIWLHRRRVRRFGPYRSWRNSSPRSPAPTRSRWPNG